MKKILLTFAFVILFLSSINGVLSWGPHVHNYLSNSIFDSNNTIGELCGSNELNKGAYRLGAEAPDLAVIYYYSQGGANYRLTHNWNFAQEIFAQALTDDEKCLAWGIASHLIADSIAHTSAVPQGIMTSKIPNWMSHPLLEKKTDSYFVITHPELLQSTPKMMDALYGPKGDRYVEMITKAMGTNSGVDVKSELAKLSQALGTFYDGQFRPTGQSWIFQTYPYIDKFTNFLAPVIGSTNSVKMDDYYDKSEEQILNTFNNWGSRYQQSPHGFTELSAADKSIGSGVIPLIIIGLIIITPFGLVFLNRKRRFKWLWLLLIPALLFLMVIVVYMIL